MGTHTGRTFSRTLADLGAKLNRQQAAVETTKEMIEAVTALQKQEQEQVNTPAQPGKTGK